MLIFKFFNERLKITLLFSFIDFLSSLVMKTIRFQSKEESNREQEVAFLALSPSDRFLHFLKLCEAIGPFQNKPKMVNDNYVIERKPANGLRE